MARSAGQTPQDPPSWTIGDERIRRLEVKYYPAYVDEHARFDTMVSRYSRSGAAVLDAGAGRGLRYDYTCRRRAGRFAGADLDPGVLDNPLLTDAAIADLSALPYPDAAFDVVISKYVFEHLIEPIAVMRELRRVLKPGGHLLIQTPNRWHYVALAARLTPTRFHVWFNLRRDREAGDTFPTRYRANDRRTLARLARTANFRIVGFEAVETKPDYLFFHPVAYRAGVAYERLVNRSEWLAGLRVQWLVAMRAIEGPPATATP
ncbi:MAG: class I SAM-dependent methyltransferase [Actinomycetota bacterium]